VQVLFAANAVYGKIALGAVSPAALLGARVPAGALLFFGLRTLQSKKSGWQPLERRDLWRVTFSALLGVSLNQAFYFQGLARTTATNMTVLGTLIPVLAMGVSIALGHERATLRRIAGLVVALGGALVVVLFGRPGHLKLEFGVGEVLSCCSSACYALYLVVSRPLFLRYRTDTAITWIFAVAALTMAPFCLVPMAHEVPATTPAALGSIVFIILGPTVAAYFLNGFALRRASASLVAVYIYAQPLIAAGLAFVLLHERISPATGVGGVLIGIGIALVSLA
jgi:drug/metabolite transporter (DMT)-like permease